MVPPRRRGAYRVDPRVLEAHTTQRYETFRLPRPVTELLRVPRDENDWLKAEQLAAIVRDLADGCETLYLQADDLAAVHGETQTKHGIGTGVLTAGMEVAGKLLPPHTRVLAIERGAASDGKHTSTKGRGAGPADRGTAPSRGTGAAARGTAPSHTVWA